jgi:SpoVK/Ycf46/Vps4 family AAA+-type ATPase
VNQFLALTSDVTTLKNNSVIGATKNKNNIDQAFQQIFNKVNTRFLLNQSKMKQKRIHR